MPNLIIRGRNLDVGNWHRDLIEQKLGKLERYVDQIQEITVELAREQRPAKDDRNVIQVTMVVNGTILRGEERGADLRTTIDAVHDLMQQQILRYKSRQQRRRRVSAAKTVGAQIAEQVAADRQPGTEAESDTQVVRQKQVPVKPLSVEDAIEEMELLGHDFFLFINADTNTYNVVYRRTAGGFGLLEPVLA